MTQEEKNDRLHASTESAEKNTPLHKASLYYTMRCKLFGKEAVDFDISASIVKKVAKRHNITFSKPRAEQEGAHTPTIKEEIKKVGIKTAVLEIFRNLLRNGRVSMTTGPSTWKSTSGRFMNYDRSDDNKRIIEEAAKAKDELSEIMVPEEMEMLLVDLCIEAVKSDKFQYAVMIRDALLSKPEAQGKLANDAAELLKSLFEKIDKGSFGINNILLAERISEELLKNINNIEKMESVEMRFDERFWASASAKVKNGKIIEFTTDLEKEFYGSGSLEEVKNSVIQTLKRLGIKHEFLESQHSEDCHLLEISKDELNKALKDGKLVVNRREEEDGNEEYCEITFNTNKVQ